MKLFEYGVQDWITRPEEAFDAFLASYQFEGRTLRKSSFVIYKGMFLRLSEWLKEGQMTVLDVTGERLEAFLQNRNLSPETRHRYLLMFREMFNRLAALKALEEGEANKNPAISLLLQGAAPEREDPDWLTSEELHRLIGLHLPKGSWKKSRNVALCYFLLGAGLKASELLSLKVSDLNYKEGHLRSIWVRPHLPRPGRKVPVQPMFRAQMEAWAETHKSAALPADYLFPSKPTGGEITQVSLFRVIKTFLEEADIEKRYMSATLLRNTCGRIWLQSHPSTEVMQWLGHEQLKTTELLLAPEQRSKDRAYQS